MMSTQVHYVIFLRAVLHGKLQKLKLLRFNYFKCCFEAFVGYRSFSFYQSLKCEAFEAFEAFHFLQD